MEKNSKKQVAEKRRFLRIPFESVLECRPCRSNSKNQGMSKAVEVLSKNISQSGILINSSRKVELGQEIELKISVPSMEGYSKVKIAGRVCWVRQLNSSSFDCGLEFIKVKPEDADTLKDFIEFFPPEQEELELENVAILDRDQHL